MSYANAVRLTALLCVSCLPAMAGYTHYFRWHQKPDPAALADCIREMRQIIDARKPMLAGPEGDGQPIVLPDSLVFNGIGDNGHEPFIFPGATESVSRGSGIPPGYNFCKTAAKPYDAVVTACLLVARDHFPKSVLAIDSDGSWSEGSWQDGSIVYTSVLQRPASDPIGGEVIRGERAHSRQDEDWSIPQGGVLLIILGGWVVVYLARKVAA